jgi:porin
MLIMDDWTRPLLVLFVTCTMVASSSLAGQPGREWPVDDCTHLVSSCGCSPFSRVYDRWFCATRSLEEHGIEFEGAMTQFYQGVASGGIEREFRYCGHGDYDLDLDLGRICGLDGFTIDLGSEHRFADTVNESTGSVVPVALLPNLPEPETNSLALTEIRFNYELREDLEIFWGKVDTLVYDRNAFADGKGAEKFFSTAFNYNPIATRTIPFSTLGGGIHVTRDGEPVIILAVFDTEDTGTRVAIDELFAEGAAVFGELRLPVTLMGRRGQQAILGSWSSRTFASLNQTGRIDFPDIPIARKEGSWCLCWNADQFLWQDPCDESRGWGLFGRAGISDGNPNPVEWFLSFGLGGNSWLPGREDDRFGIGWYYLGISDELGPVLSTLLDDGQGVELYYDIAISERCRLSLDLQVVEPTSVGVDTALVPGIRSHVEF